MVNSNLWFDYKKK